MATDFLNRRMDLHHSVETSNANFLTMDTSYPVKLAGYVTKIFIASADYNLLKWNIVNAKGETILTVENSNVYDFAGRPIGSGRDVDVYPDFKDVFKKDDYIMVIIDFDHNKLFMCSQTNFSKFIAPSGNGDGNLKLFDIDGGIKVNGFDFPIDTTIFKEAVDFDKEEDKHSLLRHSEDNVIYEKPEIVDEDKAGNEIRTMTPVAKTSTININKLNAALSQFILPYTLSGNGQDNVRDIMAFCNVNGVLNDKFINEFCFNANELENLVLVKELPSAFKRELLSEYFNITNKNDYYYVLARNIKKNPPSGYLGELRTSNFDETMGYWFVPVRKSDKKFSSLFEIETKGFYVNGEKKEYPFNHEILGNYIGSETNSRGSSVYLIYHNDSSMNINHNNYQYAGESFEYLTNQIYSYYAKPFKIPSDDVILSKSEFTNLMKVFNFFNTNTKETSKNELKSQLIAQNSSTNTNKHYLVDASGNSFVEETPVISIIDYPIIYKDSIDSTSKVLNDCKDNTFEGRTYTNEVEDKGIVYILSNTNKLSDKVITEDYYHYGYSLSNPQLSIKKEGNVLKEKVASIKNGDNYKDSPYVFTATRSLSKDYGAGGRRPLRIVSNGKTILYNFISRESLANLTVDSNGVVNTEFSTRKFIVFKFIQRALEKNGDKTNIYVEQNKKLYCNGRPLYIITKGNQGYIDYVKTVGTDDSYCLAELTEDLFLKLKNTYVSDFMYLYYIDTTGNIHRIKYYYHDNTSNIDTYDYYTDNIVMPASINYTSESILDDTCINDIDTNDDYKFIKAAISLKESKSNYDPHKDVLERLYTSKSLDTLEKTKNKLAALIDIAVDYHLYPVDEKHTDIISKKYENYMTNISSIDLSVGVDEHIAYPINEAGASEYLDENKNAKYGPAMNLVKLAGDTAGFTVHHNMEVPYLSNTKDATGGTIYSIPSYIKYIKEKYYDNNANLRDYMGFKFSGKMFNVLLECITSDINTKEKFEYIDNNAIALYNKKSVTSIASLKSNVSNIAKTTSDNDEYLFIHDKRNNKKYTFKNDSNADVYFQPALRLMFNIPTEASFGFNESKFLSGDSDTDLTKDYLSDDKYLINETITGDRISYSVGINNESTASKEPVLLSINGNEGSIELDEITWDNLLNSLGNNKNINILGILKKIKNDINDNYILETQNVNDEVPIEKNLNDSVTDVLVPSTDLGFDDKHIGEYEHFRNPAGNEKYIKDRKAEFDPKHNLYKYNYGYGYRGDGLEKVDGANYDSGYILPRELNNRGVIVLTTKGGRSTCMTGSGGDRTNYQNTSPEIIAKRMYISEKGLICTKEYFDNEYENGIENDNIQKQINRMTGKNYDMYCYNMVQLTNMVNVLTEKVDSLTEQLRMANAHNHVLLTAINENFSIMKNAGSSVDSIGTRSQLDEDTRTEKYRINVKLGQKIYYGDTDLNGLITDEDAKNISVYFALVPTDGNISNFKDRVKQKIEFYIDGKEDEKEKFLDFYVNNAKTIYNYDGVSNIIDAKAVSAAVCDNKVKYDLAGYLCVDKDGNYYIESNATKANNNIKDRKLKGNVLYDDSLTYNDADTLLNTMINLTDDKYNALTDSQKYIADFDCDGLRANYKDLEELNWFLDNTSAKYTNNMISHANVVQYTSEELNKKKPAEVIAELKKNPIKINITTDKNVNKALPTLIYPGDFDLNGKIDENDIVILSAWLNNNDDYEEIIKFTVDGKPDSENGNKFAKFVASNLHYLTPYSRYNTDEVIDPNLFYYDINVTPYKGELTAGTYNSLINACTGAIELPRTATIGHVSIDHDGNYFFKIDKE